MNDFDQEKIDRLMDQPLTQYEKVLLEKERRERWQKYQKEAVGAKFDWFSKREMGELYNYDPRND